jgi:hypothetical protein
MLGFKIFRDTSTESPYSSDVLTYCDKLATTLIAFFLIYVQWRNYDEYFSEFYSSLKEFAK